MKNIPAIFEQTEIRRAYDEKTETWWFAVVDIVMILTQHADYKTANCRLQTARITSLTWPMLKHCFVWSRAFLVLKPSPSSYGSPKSGLSGCKRWRTRPLGWIVRAPAGKNMGAVKSGFSSA